MSIYGYNICFLDILGFSEKICQDDGLELIKHKYLELTESVRQINYKYKEVIAKGIYEGSYWSKNGIGVFYKTNILYGSDSIIIWSDRTWDEFQKVGDASKIHFTNKWMTHPKPCDPFIEICNEIICKSIEIDLPLRGALSMGNGYFDFEKFIFIGKPIIEAIKLEKVQNIIGASFCHSFEKQIIPQRFYFNFENYLKKELCGKPVQPENHTNQNVLDWARHWKETRKKDINEAIENIDFGPREDIKNNTLRFIKNSEKYMNNFISMDEINIENCYKEYYKNCGLPIRMLWNGSYWDIGDVNTINTYVSK